jgi:hypothetical protein
MIVGTMKIAKTSNSSKIILVKFLINVGKPYK